MADPRLLWRQLDAPDFQGASNILLNAGKSLDRGFDAIGGVIAQYKKGQQETADNALLNDLAKIKNEQEFDNYLAKGGLSNVNVSPELRKHVLNMRPKFIDQQTARDNNTRAWNVDARQERADGRTAETHANNMAEFERVRRAREQARAAGDKAAEAAALNRERILMGEINAYNAGSPPAGSTTAAPTTGAGAATAGSGAATATPTGSTFFSLLNRTEGGGRYNTLFGHSQRPGGRFEGVDITNMTLDELAAFSAPSGAYGQWVKGKVGHVATPMGAGQIVGTTLREAAKQLGIPGNAKFTPQLQNMLIGHLAKQSIAGASTQAEKRSRLRGTWEGFKSVSDAELDAAIAEVESGALTTPTGAAGPFRPGFEPGNVIEPAPPVNTLASRADIERLLGPRPGQVVTRTDAAGNSVPEVAGGLPRVGGSALPDPLAAAAARVTPTGDAETATGAAATVAPITPPAPAVVAPVPGAAPAVGGTTPADPAAAGDPATTGATGIPPLSTAPTAERNAAKRAQLQRMFQERQAMEAEIRASSPDMTNEAIASLMAPLDKQIADFRAEIVADEGTVKTNDTVRLYQTIVDRPDINNTAEAVSALMSSDEWKRMTPVEQEEARAAIMAAAEKDPTRLNAGGVADSTIKSSGANQIILANEYLVSDSVGQLMSNAERYEGDTLKAVEVLMEDLEVTDPRQDIDSSLGDYLNLPWTEDGAAWKHAFEKRVMELVEQTNHTVPPDVIMAAMRMSFRRNPWGQNTINRKFRDDEIVQLARTLAGPTERTRYREKKNAIKRMTSDFAQIEAASADLEQERAKRLRKNPNDPWADATEGSNSEYMKRRRALFARQSKLINDYAYLLPPKDPKVDPVAALTAPPTRTPVEEKPVYRPGAGYQMF